MVDLDPEKTKIATLHSELTGEEVKMVVTVPSWRRRQFQRENLPWQWSWDKDLAAGWGHDH